MLNWEVIPLLRELTRSLTSAPAEFTFTDGDATISASAARAFVPTAALDQNSSLTLTDGIDGMKGSFWVQQDATGGRTLAVVADGRTILRLDPDTDDDPEPAANRITAYDYEFATIAGTAYLILAKTTLL